MTEAGKRKFPRIIHQTWKTKEIPKVWEETPESWKKNHPNWEYWLWTDEDNRNLIKDSYPWFLSQYDSYVYNIQRVDAVRYFILYTYGGLYVDLDIKAEKSFEPLVNWQELKTNNEIIFANSSHLNVITNAFIISKKGAKFWEIVFEKLKTEQYKYYNFGKHLNVMYSTGPTFLNNIFKNNKTNTIVLNKDIVSACSICDKKPCTTNKSFTTILEGNSWTSVDTKLYQKFYCNKGKILLGISLLLFIMFMLFYYYHYKKSIKNKNK